MFMRKYLLLHTLYFPICIHVYLYMHMQICSILILTKINYIICILNINSIHLMYTEVNVHHGHLMRCPILHVRFAYPICMFDFMSDFMSDLHVRFHGRNFIFVVRDLMNHQKNHKENQ